MKRIIIVIFLICGFFVCGSSNAVTEKKSVAVFPLNTSINTSSHAVYSNAQDMFAADLVNSLQKYKDLDVMDVSNSESILRLAEKTRQYEQLTKQFKQRYIVDYEKAETVARALGVNYLVFIHGGFDTERDFLKSNWKYRCQWIWANPVKSSALLNINITLVDVKNHNIAFQSSIKKDIAMDNFYQPSQNFGENVIPTSQIKKFTLPNSIKIAQQLHSVMYPFLNEKYSQKDAFIDKYIPNNGTIDTYDNGQTLPDEKGVFHDNPRKNIYLDWVKDEI